jgi:hypothetical protein
MFRDWIYQNRRMTDHSAIFFLATHSDSSCLYQRKSAFCGGSLSRLRFAHKADRSYAIAARSFVALEPARLATRESAIPITTCASGIVGDLKDFFPLRKGRRSRFESNVRRAETWTVDRHTGMDSPIDAATSKMPWSYNRTITCHPGLVQGSWGHPVMQRQRASTNTWKRQHEHRLVQLAIERPRGSETWSVCQRSATSKVPLGVIHESTL